MEALAAISLVGNIIQSVDLGTKLFADAEEIQESATGMTKDDQDLANITREMRNPSLKVGASATGLRNDDQRALQYLARECCDLSERILDLI
jgi:hypothetical protein